MKAQSPTPDERRRLDSLRQYGVPDTLPEVELDDLTKLAAHVCEAPIALISLIDEGRQWFKSRVGLELTETPLDVSFCVHAVREPDLFLIHDATMDERFVANPLVTGDPGIRFYAGARLISREGEALGALSVIDLVPRALTPAQAKALPMLARQVMAQLEFRRQARALEASEERIREIVESSLDAIVSIGHEGRIEAFNAAAEKVFGWSREEVMGRQMADVIIPQRLREAHRHGMARYLETAQAVILGRRIELTALRADGAEFPVELTVTRLGRSSPPMFTAFIRDITERKHAELAVRRLAAIVESSEDAMIGKDTDGIVMSWNKGAEKIYGFTESEMVGSSIRRIIPADLQDEEEQILGRVRRGEIVEHFDTRRVRKDGRMIDVSVSVSPIKDASGEVIGVSKVARDITEAKRTEARMRRLIESNAQGVLFWRADGKILEANDAFLRMTGYSREDLVAGRINWAAMTPPEYAIHDRRALDELAANGVSKPFEKDYVCKDGSRLPVLIGAATFEDDKQEGVCFVVDLTERKKLEQQFLRAQRMESIGTLAGGIAHDLNNALGPIVTSLAVLRQRLADPGSQELLSIINASAQRAADMVRQVLSFARGVEGRRIDLQIRHLIQDIEKIANETFLKSIHVRSIIPTDLWTILGDPTQIHQVLMNLCVNARDAMPGGGALTLHAENVTLDAHYAAQEPEAKPGPYVFLQVEDSGTGIPREIIEKIFDPFFTTKEVGKGTGLGLSTSMAIIKAHGGFMRVYSELAKGTKFKVYLPAQTETSAEAAAQIADELPRGHGELILVVDDEASVREVTRQTLEAFGYSVLLASDGADAVTVFATRQSEIAVVLTDMMMPVMDGPATIQVLRKFNPAVRIIAASGLAANGHVAHAARLGIRHFLPKPYTAEALLKTLSQILIGK